MRVIIRRQQSITNLEGAVPEVHLYDMEWWDLEVVGYTSVTVAFRTGLDEENAIMPRVPNSGVRA